MGKLIYTTIASLDGFINDEDGKFDWSAPDAQVHAFVNDQERPIGTYLYGRRLYEVMAVWESLKSFVDPPPVIRDYAAIWQATDKIVYSRTLKTVTSSRTRLEREFDPAAIRQLKESAATDISVGGAELAAVAFQAGLVDECHVFVTPHLVGGGTRSFPGNGNAALGLLGQDRFDNGVVHLHYRVRPTP